MKNLLILLLFLLMCFACKKQNRLASNSTFNYEDFYISYTRDDTAHVQEQPEIENYPLYIDSTNLLGGLNIGTSIYLFINYADTTLITLGQLYGLSNTDLPLDSSYKITYNKGLQLEYHERLARSLGGSTWAIGYTTPGQNAPGDYLRIDSCYSGKINYPANTVSDILIIEGSFNFKVEEDRITYDNDNNLIYLGSNGIHTIKNGKFRFGQIYHRM